MTASRVVQVGELMVAVQKLNNEKVLLEQSMEMEEEGIVNRLQRVIESVLARNKAVEACLEAHGLSVKDLHPPPIDMSTEWAYSRSPTRSDAQARLNSGKLLAYYLLALSLNLYLCQSSVSSAII